MTVNEGSLGSKSGTFGDAGADVVTIAASFGSVSQSGTKNGSWTWTLNSTDGPDQSQTVTITATDSDGLQSEKSFELVVNNKAPSVSFTGSASVTVNEGATATKIGNFSDVGADIVTVTASVGSVTQSGTRSGIWQWSLEALDGPDETQTVTITATDSDGLQATTTFALTVQNAAPSLALTGSATVSVNEGSQATQSGTFFDPGTDVVELTATSGAVVRDGSQSGTWTWFFDPADGPDQSRTVVITARDTDGASSTVSFDLVVKDVAPTIALLGNANASSQTPYKLQLGSIVDPGLDSITAYQINWGDGTSTGKKAGTPTGTSVTHKYTTMGVNRTITVDLYDEFGQAATWPRAASSSGCTRRDQT